MPLFPPNPAESSLISTRVTRKTESMQSSQNIDAGWAGFPKQLKLNSDNISNILKSYFNIQNLHLESLSSHFVTFSLKVFKITLFLISVGTRLHAFELRTLREFRSYWLLLRELVRNSVFDLRLNSRLSLIWNILFIMHVEMFCLALKIQSLKIVCFSGEQ